jgi:hypothetical protein
LSKTISLIKKQSLLTDKKQFKKISVKCKGGTTGIPRVTKGRGGGTTGNFLKIQNSKSAPNHTKLSENCRKQFLSSKQLVSTDKNMF